MKRPFVALIVLSLLATVPVFAAPVQCTASNTITADVVVLDQVLTYNRRGAFQPFGKIFALRRDVESVSGGALTPGNVRLKSYKRPRPIVLRVNQGQCLNIKLTNLLGPAVSGAPATSTVSMHVLGLAVASSLSDDGSFVGSNASSLVPTGATRSYTLVAEHMGTFLLQTESSDMGNPTITAGDMTLGLFGAVNVEPPNAIWYRSQVTHDDLAAAMANGKVDYNKLKILDGMEIAHSDLTAIIAGPDGGRFPKGTFPPNYAEPDRDRPFREFTLIYHEDFLDNQAFPGYFNDAVFAKTLTSSTDNFGINYGMDGIGSIILAQRMELGPTAGCVDCKFEEFFLSSWAQGDPATIVDNPTNTGSLATKAFYPDDPSNVYHSYLGDHTTFRVLHGGAAIHHVHHLHAHQWLHSPNDDGSSYLDSQAIGPGSGYTLEMTYHGAGNRNLTVGDSIFHCHIYPHFASGMWSLWRVHDVFEDGTLLDKDGRPVTGVANNRALPDAEIKTGTPIPALVPMPSIAMAPAPEANVQIVNGQVKVTPKGGGKLGNPGYPFFIAGVAGHRAPMAPLDFAKDEMGAPIDGGLPRHRIIGGTVIEKHTPWDFSKDNPTLIAEELNEAGEPTEQAAMAYHEMGSHPSKTPEGVPATFLTNGHPRQQGAPYADPCIGAAGDEKPPLRVYKAANIQMDVQFNKAGWHFPQQRMIVLWDDIPATRKNERPPQPFFFRANSGDCVEYWHANFIPSVYELDDFQVRTPTDVIGQHIHLVKFDVTSSDGAGNGFNYEDGTLAPDEVTDRINAINKTGGIITPAGKRTLKAKAYPPFMKIDPEHALGAQATIQRWWADPLIGGDINCPVGAPAEQCDRTLRTIFTHDHFGPSTHQEAGLYGGLLTEPKGSTWRDPVTQEVMGSRKSDGGPTSWQADVYPTNLADSYREFALEFQDMAMAYLPTSRKTPDPIWGWADYQNAVDAQYVPGSSSATPCPLPTPCPKIVDDFDLGSLTTNYRSEPLALRAGVQPNSVRGIQNDLAFSFASIPRQNPWLNTQPTTYPPLTPGVDGTDPFTPLFRTYQGDRVWVRILVGGQGEIHHFSMNGLRWLFEPSSSSSGWRASQAMGISEHYESIFRVPYSTMNARGFTDHLYETSSSDQGREWGMWGLLRAYDPAKDTEKLVHLPSNPKRSAPVTAPVCDPKAPMRKFDVIAALATDVIGSSGITFNTGYTVGTSSSGPITLGNGIVYVESRNLTSGKLTNVDPLILRAKAGDCIQVTLHNQIPEKAPYTLVGINLDNPASNGSNDPQFSNFTYYPSATVGLNTQLVERDTGTSDGMNVGQNAVQTIAPAPNGGATKVYTWYAGAREVDAKGNATWTPIEFGGVNLMPADPLGQHPNGLAGALIIEPLDAIIDPKDEAANSSATIKRANGKPFREFVAVTFDDLNLSNGTNQAFNYGAEPFSTRYGNATPGAFNANAVDLSCARSDLFTGGDPQTPVFSANAGQEVRFRFLHPGGSADGQVITIHGHSWQEEPYTKGSLAIGDNPKSQWTGSQMGHGATNHLAVVIPSAGGPNAIPGDYMYRSFLADQFQLGLWGIFRVFTPGSDALVVTSNNLNPQGGSVSGMVVANPDQPANYKPPTSLTVTAYSGANCSGTAIGTASVSNGTFSLSNLKAADVCLKLSSGATQIASANLCGGANAAPKALSAGEAAEQVPQGSVSQS
ncbi:MAG TPA: hypothetical protein VMU84_14480, partial [Thermoanaerobaculia bacterium]|nr:hypothetical protein [Thermoanaerobaculia bacterium]